MLLGTVGDSTTELAGWVQTCCLGTWHSSLRTMPVMSLPNRGGTGHAAMLFALLTAICMQALSSATLLACSGGLVSSDWADMDWAKIGFLVGNTTTYPTGLGLVPWYLPGFTTSKLRSHACSHCKLGMLRDAWVPEYGQSCSLDVQLPLTCCSWGLHGHACGTIS